MGRIWKIYTRGLKRTAQVHTGRVRIHFCWFNGGKTVGEPGAWSKRVVPTLLMSNAWYLGRNVQ